MTEQQYRVVADWDKGDDPTRSMAKDGDLLVFRASEGGGLSKLVRIERPVPTADEPVQDGPLTRGLEQSRRGETVDLGSFAQYAEHPPVPTREQIADLIALHYGWGKADEEDREAGDALLTLLQKGADR